LAAAGTENVQLGPKVRTVTAGQGFDTRKWGCLRTYPLALELTNRFYGLKPPVKFKLGVTGCRNNCMKVEGNDLGIKGAMLVELDPESCQACGERLKVSRGGALIMGEKAPVIDRSKRLSCGRCLKVCPSSAFSGLVAYDVYFGGNFGNGSMTGRKILPLVDNRKVLFKILDAAVDFFQERGQSGQRFRSVIRRVGREALAKVVSEAAVGASPVI
jgi:dissimilatory sulfite reductase (desulfoviridin) alpha/beta subunit